MGASDVETLDELDRHLPEAGSIERAAIVPGVFLAWCANLDLLDPQFVAAHEREMLRVRMRDFTPAEFFVKTAGHRLGLELLSESGRRFAIDHYPGYPAEFANALGIDVERIYTAKDGWDTYDLVAKPLTAAYYAFARAGHKPHAERKHWWQLWRRNGS